MALAIDLEGLLVREGVAAPPDQIRAVLDRAAEEGRDPVEALVEEEVVVEDVMAEVLARACGTVVVDLDGDQSFDGAEHLSKRIALDHLLVPLAAPSGGRVRVAFANPLNRAGRDLVEGILGVKVQVLTATLSGVRRAIESAYAGRTTRIVDGSDIQPEITRRMLAPSGTDTSPLLRLEAQATPEQRHEALLLALIERGVLTRADYHAALKRLVLGPRED